MKPFSRTLSHKTRRLAATLAEHGSVIVTTDGTRTSIAKARTRIYSAARWAEVEVQTVANGGVVTGMVKGPAR